MNSTPSAPPASASAPNCRIPVAALGATVHMNSTGTVKISPEARDDDAAPAPWPMFHSRMPTSGKMNLRLRNRATMITASGIEVPMVNPTRRPR